MPYRRAPRRRMGRNRRKLVWARTFTTLTVTANNSVTNIDLLQAYKAVVGASSAGITIMRTRLDVYPTSTITNNDGFFIGLKVDDLDQVVASSASALAISPNGNPDSDWMFNSWFNALPTYNWQAANNGIHIDLRAKRRMEEVQQAYLLSIQPVGVAAGGLPLTLTVHSNVLIALP